MIVEVEIGPHFLTFYCDDRSDMLQQTMKYYKRFCNEFPELAPYQPNNFAHEAKDPNMFHPYGNPIELKYTCPAHFHIKTIKKPTASLISTILKSMTKAGFKVDRTLSQKRLEDYKLDKYKNLKYLKRGKMDYNEYIATLKIGEWRNGQQILL